MECCEWIEVEVEHKRHELIEMDKELAKVELDSLGIRVTRQDAHEEAQE